MIERHTGTGNLAGTAALARLLGFTTGGVTAVLDRLERAGYIRRRPDPGDRRRQVVETTASRNREVFGGLIDQTTALLAGYTDEQLRLIDDFLTRARQLTATHADALTGHHRATAPRQSPLTGS